MGSVLLTAGLVCRYKSLLAVFPVFPVFPVLSGFYSFSALPAMFIIASIIIVPTRLLPP